MATKCKINMSILVMSSLQLVIKYIDSVWLSDSFPVEMFQVIRTTIGVGSHMEKDEFTA